eukprot:CAMPEP_0183713240 /NCGR_PEP_ID=MMETSP0737-20130205/8138_1 /TAXON_ID=385413 /ORGANISM="Thalassiosira miniscula, Strain CCMP1093" /LENGTH=901 /DNA_ID=CAMNT_0025941993 /DNA_START=330 /DNA_END=3035 /DNA_ORIENTATION=-
MNDQKDPRYAAGGGNAAAASSKKVTEEEVKAAEIAKAMGTTEDAAAMFKKKKSVKAAAALLDAAKSITPQQSAAPPQSAPPKSSTVPKSTAQKSIAPKSTAPKPAVSTKSSKRVVGVGVVVGSDNKGNAGDRGGGDTPRSESPQSVHTSDPPDFTNPTIEPFHNTYNSSPVRSPDASLRSSGRSIDPEGGSNAALGEVWEVSRPPGMVRDGGNDHGYFYVPSPTSSDGEAFHAFLNNQKYTTHRAPCVDWRSWIANNPRRTLIHFSEVPREAMEKGRHLLNTRPGSAFFSASQLSIQDGFGGEGGYDDTGSYAQMFFHQPLVATRGGDVDGSTIASSYYAGGMDPVSNMDSLQEFEQWRRSGGRPPQGGARGVGSRGPGGGGGGGYDGQGSSPPENAYSDYASVSFLRKGFTQNIVAGMVAFTGPGLFNAMNGLGNAGGSDPTVAATMNATLYSTFSIFGVLSGSLFNMLGTKILMSFGSLTYAFYAISVYLWGTDEKYASMAIIAAAILGLGAACLWGAQGTMTLSYALEAQKGLFFGIFWLIFNMGGVMGGFISMGINMAPDEERASAVTPETYFTFCGLMIAGSIFAFFFVISPSRVVKADGSAVQFEQTDAAEGIGELKEIAKLFKNRYMLLLTPLIIQSNWFYAYEFGGINGLLFDAPTRGLNSAVYWAISGASSYVYGVYYLDSEAVGGRRQRAIRGLALVSVINLGQWIYAIIYQFSTGYDKGNGPDPLINYSDGGAYAAPMLLFMYCGLADSLVQTYAYWIIGAISNTPSTLSRYVGYYKGVQSFGGALSWIIEAEGTSYRTQLLICSFLAVLFIPFTYMVSTTVQDKGTDIVGNGEEFAENAAVLQNDGYAESRRFAEMEQRARENRSSADSRRYAEMHGIGGSKKKPARIV